MNRPEKPSKRKDTVRMCMVVHATYPMGETRVEREARALHACGYEVDTICLLGKDEPGEEVVDGITVYRLPVKRRMGRGLSAQLFEYLSFFILAFFKLNRLHRLHRYRVVQIHNIPDLLVFVGLIPKLTGARIVLDLHDLMPEFYAARFRRGLKSWPVRFITWTEKISCKFADQVITVTSGWRNTLIERGVPGAKVNVVMNVPDEQIFHPARDLRDRQNHNGHFQLLYHGNLTYRYGIDLAVKAVNILRDHIPNIHLYIHGGGDYRKALIKMTEDLALKDYVGFNPAPIPSAELPGLIQGADVCLVPYRNDVFTDGILPTKLMEYAALEMPVIAARTTAIQAYFNDSMVEFFEPGDVNALAQRILELFQNPSRLEDLKRGSQGFNQNYNWRKVGSDYVALIDRLSGRLGSGEKPHPGEE